MHQDSWSGAFYHSWRQAASAICAARNRTLIPQMVRRSPRIRKNLRTSASSACYQLNASEGLAPAHGLKVEVSFTCLNVSQSRVYEKTQACYCAGQCRQKL